MILGTCWENSPLCSSPRRCCCCSNRRRLAAACAHGRKERSRRAAPRVKQACDKAPSPCCSRGAAASGGRAAWRTRTAGWEQDVTLSGDGDAAGGGGWGGRGAKHCIGTAHLRDSSSNCCSWSQRMNIGCVREERKEPSCSAPCQTGAVLLAGVTGGGGM